MTIAAYAKFWTYSQELTESAFDRARECCFTKSSFSLTKVLPLSHGQEQA